MNPHISATKSDVVVATYDVTWLPTQPSDINFTVAQLRNGAADILILFSINAFL
jgi:hypothetical protein